MSALRDWARLDARWYEDPVLRAAAKQAPAAFVMWPVLVAMAKASSHVDDNPEGLVRVSMDDLARACCVTNRRAMAALEALVEGEFVIVEAYRVGLLEIRLTSFAKWQTPRASKAEHAANKRWRTSREKAATRHPAEGEAAASSLHGVMPDVDVDVDVDVDTTLGGGEREAASPIQLPPNPRTTSGQVRQAQAQLESHVSSVILNMIARRNGASMTMLTAQQELEQYWKPACDLLAEHGRHRLREAVNADGVGGATSIKYVATICGRLRDTEASAVANDPDLGGSEWADYRGKRATAPTDGEAA